jgi:hypothetical protein
VSLLMTRAGRVFWISPPIAGSKDTSQTSPRCGTTASAMPRWFPPDITEQALAPGLGLGLARFVGRHGRVAGREVLADDMGASKIVQEAADPPAPNDAVQAVINFGIHGDSKFLRHFCSPIRIALIAFTHAAWSSGVLATFEGGPP